MQVAVTRRQRVVSWVAVGVGVLGLTLLWFGGLRAVSYAGLPAIALLVCLGLYNQHLFRRERRRK
jgi:hypothetical protein